MAALIIKPQKALFDIDFKGIWTYRDLIFLLVRRDYVSQVKQTVLGPLWYIITPMISVVVYSVVFNGIAHISTEGTPPILFYLTGITLWSFFSSTLNSTSNVFVNNANIFGKVYFPRLIIPIANSISAYIRLGIQFMLLFIVLFYFYYQGIGLKFSSYTLLIPFILIITSILAAGIGIIISSLTTKYRDFRNLIGLGIQLWMYGTPIIYPLSVIPDEYRWIAEVNPMTSLIEAFKFGLIGVGSVDFEALSISALVSIVTLFVGILSFNKIESSFMDTV